MNPHTEDPAGPRASVGVIVQFLATPLLPELPAPTGAIFRQLRHGNLTGTLDGVLSVGTPPSPGLDACIRRTADDLALARDLLARHGLAPSERALEPHRSTPGPAPATAAVRICLDATPDGLGSAGPGGLGSAGPGLDGPGSVGAGAARRWAVARAVGPVLLAAFANSPLYGGRPTGWRSTRQAIRLGLPAAAPTTGPDDRPAQAEHLPAVVCAHGRLELDVIDAQPGDGWRVAVAVATALIDDPRAADAVLAGTESLPPDAWVRAARDGLNDPALAEAARHCFVAAYGALARHGVNRGLRDAVATYIHRYVNRSRSPADDLLSSTTART